MNVYKELGIEPLINAAGTLTILGGSLLPAEVVEAMTCASRAFVDIYELRLAAGRRIAELIGVEAAHVCACASAGITLMAAACMAGQDSQKISRLPNTAGMPRRFIVQRTQRNGFDHAVETCGGELVGIEPNDEALRAALQGENIAAVLYTYSWALTGPALPLKEAARIAHEFAVPVIVDAAAETPPVENLSRFTQEGADLVVFSGGKDIRGPQASGFIVGRRDLVACCAANDSPNTAGVARGMKTGKEEIAGLVKAVELYMRQDFAGRMENWEKTIAYLLKELGALDGISAERQMPPGIGQLIPHVAVKWDAQAVGATCAEVVEKLRRGKPGIAVRLVETSQAPVIWVCVQTLQAGEERALAWRWAEIWRSRGK